MIVPGQPKITEAMDMLFYPPILSEDKETILVVAGDIWSDGNFYRKMNLTGLTWLQMLAPRFHSVVMVLGNHDYWGCKLDDEHNKVKKYIDDNNLKNCYMMENDTVVIENVKIVGSTLWTSFNNGNPLTMMMGSGYMQDYKYITKKDGQIYRKLLTRDILEKYIRSKEYIFNNAVKDYPEQKLIVVTHMAPSELSVHAMYKNPRDFESNFLYFSNLEVDVCYSEIDFWFHGHTHHPFNYFLGDCNVICNPRGYTGHEDHGFDPLFRIELK
jgi:predicted phosphohydrolase